MRETIYISKLIRGTLPNTACYHPEGDVLGKEMCLDEGRPETELCRRSWRAYYQFLGAQRLLTLEVATYAYRDPKFLPRETRKNEALDKHEQIRPNYVQGDSTREGALITAPAGASFQSCQSRPICLLFRFVVFHVKPAWALFTYLIVGSLVGYLALKVSKPRATSFRPRDLDVFFTSVSAITVSSMSTVEMEVFSNTQLIIMIILMFIGGELFTSMLGLQLARSKLSGNLKNIENRVGSTAVVVSQTSPIHNNFVNQIELGLVTSPQLENDKPETDVADGLNCLDSASLKYNSIVTLAYVALAYILTVVAIGSGIVSAYMSHVPSARRILKNKGLDIQTFSLFTTVSSFTNCGFIPTNENMIIFTGNPGLLLLLIPQILMGNTLYPPCLLFVIWVLKKTTKRPAFGYMLANYRDMGYNHLFSGPRAALLVVTAFGFILIQFALFCSMEWNSGALDGLNAYQKLVSSLFQVVNTRHAGENAFDFSIIAPAVRVLFVVMM
ncbi:Sodium transporter HKT1 [Morella rubra]|uniref:Sodium transporter HKT1 n=1 Tax=Morella rubra TaxID=262757 RepID=A0A6A1WPI4_9ROSI|nr:Sodium transporter HKT1 [Morella rubra]